MSKARRLAELGNVYDDGALSNRNLIINGAMNVAQRGASATGVTTSGYYTVDRWKMNGNNGTWTVGQDTDTPDGFASSYKMTLTSTETIGSTSNMSLEQKMEGINLQSLAYSSSAAKDIILSFWVKSNITGNYCVNTYQDDGSSNYPETYTINTADTWEYKTIKYTGNTSTALDNDSNSSLRVIFFVVAGSALNSGSTGSRVAYSDDTYAAGQSAQIDAVNDYWQITGVQLEVGDTATPFEHRSYGQELALCQRYYTKFSFPQTTSFFPSHRQTTNTVRSTVTTPVPMRATPSINGSGQPNLSYHWNDGVGFLVTSGTSLTVFSSGLDANRFTINNGSVTGVGTNVGVVFAYSGYLECNAEL